MVKRGPTNPRLAELISKLEKEEKGIWKRTAQLLNRPRRSRAWINLSKIDRYCAENETVLVPGKVLASGELTKPVTIAAWRISESAKTKIEKSKGKVITIEKLMKDNPKGSGIKVMIA